MITREHTMHCLGVVRRITADQLVGNRRCQTEPDGIDGERAHRVVAQFEHRGNTGGRELVEAVAVHYPGMRGAMQAQ